MPKKKGPTAAERRAGPTEVKRTFRPVGDGLNQPFAALATLLPAATLTPEEMFPKSLGFIRKERQRIRTADLDAVVASVPLNATAARVMGRGEHYEPPDKDLTHAHSETCPPLRQIADEVAAQLIGRWFGRLLVLGVLDDPNRSQRSPAAWVVRCVCGRFETRLRKTLIGGNSDGEDRCSACWSLEKIKRRYRELGAKPIEDFTKSPNHHLNSRGQP